MNVERVWVVVGSTSDYGGDSREWTVCAYLDQSSAHRHSEQTNYVARMMHKGCKKIEEHLSHTEFVQLFAGKKNVFDPQMDMGRDGVDYSVRDVVLYTHFDQFQEEKGML